jgi:hypothetical protein
MRFTKCKNNSSLGSATTGCEANGDRVTVKELNGSWLQGLKPTLLLRLNVAAEAATP